MSNSATEISFFFKNWLMNNCNIISLFTVIITFDVNGTVYSCNYVTVICKVFNLLIKYLHFLFLVFLSRLFKYRPVCNYFPPEYNFPGC